jgi:tetratricopeptide (TPR) repeat protein
MATFIRHALAYVTRQDPVALKGLRSSECAIQLLKCLQQAPYLFVLDGFERVLTAYHRLHKAQLPDGDVQAGLRDCTNQRDGEVLRQFLQCAPSKILISSRLMPRILEDRVTQGVLPSVRHLALQGLAEPDVLQLMRSAGIHGDHSAMVNFANQFGRHSLVLRILCGAIADDPVHPGDFDAWSKDAMAGGGLRLSDVYLTQRYTHILAYAFRGLDEKKQQLLSRIAVLSNSADRATIAVLNPYLPPRPQEVPPPIDLHFDKEQCEALEAHPTTPAYRQAISDCDAALKELVDRGLLQWDRSTDTYDLHPVVRAYAYEQIDPPDRTRTFNTIRDHFASLPPEKYDQATELVHLKNSIEIYRAFVGAGRLDEAVRFYEGSFGTTLYVSLGAYHTIIELLCPLFVGNLDGYPVLSSPDAQSYVLNGLAIAWSHAARPEEANKLFERAIPLDLQAMNWSYLVIGLRNLSSGLRAVNQLAASDAVSRLAQQLAEAADNPDDVTMSLHERLLAQILFGNFDEAEKLDNQFWQRVTRQPRTYHLGDGEYLRCLLLFCKECLTETDLEHAWQRAGQGRNLSKQHDLLALRAEWSLGQGHLEAALEAIEQALQIARKTGVPSPEDLALRALIQARLGWSTTARQTLGEALESWDARLPQCGRFAAQAHLELGNREQAKSHALAAFRLAWADGPPFVRWFELQQCRQLLAALDTAEPVLPTSDPATIAPIPCATEIDAVIKKLRSRKKR